MRIFDPVFRLFESWIDPFKSQDTYQPPNRLLAYVWFYVRQAKWPFFALMVLGLVIALIEAAMFSYVGELVDLLTEFEETVGRGSGWQGLMEAYGPPLLKMLFVVALLRLILNVLDSLVEEQTIVPGFFVLMRWQNHKHIIGQSLSFFQNDLSGRVAQKVFQSGMATGDMMIALLQVIWLIAVYSVTTGVILFSLDWQLGAIVAVWVTSILLIARYFVPRVRDHARITAESGSAVTGRMVDAYANIQTVKLYGSEKSEEAGVYEASRNHRDEIIRFTRVLTLLRVTANTANSVALALIGIVIVDMWLNYQTSLGSVAFVLALSLRLRLLLNRLLGNLNGFFRNMGVTQNTMEMVAQPYAIEDAPGAPDFEYRGGRIEFRDVSFDYEKLDGVIEHLNLVVEPGEKIGIVGGSGGGKTTLMHLLMRFFDVDSGAILIDEQDIRSVRQNSLRRQFSFVQQDVQLFNRSVAENIAHGESDFDLERVSRAAELADAHEFIDGLVDSHGRKGYDAHVGERGVKLSGGQRQRIAIARALYRNAPFLVLDEATSHLDSLTEQTIQQNLLKQMSAKNVFLVAHRLSTLSGMDRILVMKDGKIAEQGTHKSLLRAKGQYFELWQKQNF